ncbi:MAG: SDR family oxidoreductase [Planctomycetota bacterium]
MTLPIDLTDRCALVTGVTSGIGVGIARRLAEAGCDIAGCGRRGDDSAEADAFRQVVEQHGRKAHYVSADLSEPDGPAGVIDASAEALGGLDVIVSNAGRNVFRGAADCTEADWDDCMQLDLASHWRLAKSAKPHLDRAALPVFIVISSNHAWNTIPGCFPYNVAKAGLNAMVQSLAIEWGPKVRAVGVAPGFIDTPGNDTWFDSFPDPAAERARTERMHPVGRLGTVDEIGALCAFLSSEHAAFISGTTLLVDGGRGALMQDD